MTNPQSPTPEAKTHDLKTWPRYFDAINAGTKTFEIRKDDRGFNPGDVLLLREWSPDRSCYTGRECRRVVTYITDWDQKEGTVVMAIAPLPHTPSPTLQSAAEGAAHKLAAYHWTSGSKTVSDYIAILLSDFSFVQELVRENERLTHPPFVNMKTEEALAHADSGDRTIDDPMTVLASEVRSLRDQLSTARAELKDQRGINDLAEAECLRLRAERDQWKGTAIKDREENVDLRNELAEVRAERDAAVKELEGARRVNARLTQVDFRNADIIDKLQEDRDVARQEASELRAGITLQREDFAKQKKALSDSNVSLRAQLAAADEMAKDFKRCAKERKQLIEGVVHAENEVTEFRNKHFDEDPGDDGQRGSPEYETLRGLEHHLSGTCIDDDGEFMPRDKYDARLLAYQAARTQGGAS